MEDQPEFVEQSGKGLTKMEPQQGSVFSSLQTLNDATEIAKQLSSSNLVPEAYKNNVPNTLIALEMANRVGTTPFMVMQNLDIIQGKPSWRASFIIAALQSCGRFGTHNFEWNRKDENDNEINRQHDSFGCRMVAPDKHTGELYKGPWITWKMVKAEGWDKRKGSKWVTMPELMFQYRAATLFGRLYAPDILTGMHSAEEVQDIAYQEVKQEPPGDEVKAKRVEDWIAKSKTVEELNQVKTAAEEDEQLKIQFEKKLNEINGGSKDE